MSKDPYRRFLEATLYEEFVKATFDVLAREFDGKVYLRKTYRGKKTGHNHEIDVSIETRMAGLDILVLIECKHYKHKVKISDIMTLAQRLDDIGAQKGVLVSTVGFQQGAIAHASAHGIALVTTEPVWRVVRHCTNADGEVVGAFLGGQPEIGGVGPRDSFLGATIVGVNVLAIPEADFAAAWRSIVNALLKESGLTTPGSTSSEVSYPCPYCGRQLRSARAKQCRHCWMDWHDPDRVICRKRG